MAFDPLVQWQCGRPFARVWATDVSFHTTVEIVSFFRIRQNHSHSFFILINSHAASKQHAASTPFECFGLLLCIASCNFSPYTRCILATSSQKIDSQQRLALNRLSDKIPFRQTVAPNAPRANLCRKKQVSLDLEECPSLLDIFSWLPVLCQTTQLPVLLCFQLETSKRFSSVSCFCLSANMILTTKLENNVLIESCHCKNVT